MHALLAYCAHAAALERREQEEARNKAFQEVERARKAAEDAGACCSGCLCPPTIGVRFLRFYRIPSLKHTCLYFCMRLSIYKHNATENARLEAVRLEMQREEREKRERELRRAERGRERQSVNGAEVWGGWK